MNSHEIDNGEPLFQFDAYESPGCGELPEGSSRSPIISPPACGVLERNLVPSTHSQLTGDIQVDSHMSAEVDDEESTQIIGKGKGVTKPMPIRPQTTPDIEHDLFDMSPSSLRLLSSQTGSRFSPSSSQTPSSFQFYSFPALHDDVQTSVRHDQCAGFFDLPFEGDDSLDPVLSGNGKGKELPPSLPPLDFSPTEFGYGKPGWPSPGVVNPAPGPSSYGSSTTDVEPSSYRDKPLSIMEETRSILRRIPSRRRSLSNLSIHSTQSLTARSLSRVKVKLGGSKGPSNLARKLLFRKREDISDVSSLNSPRDSVTDLKSSGMDLGEISQGSCLLPWRGDVKARKGGPSAIQYAEFDFETSLSAPGLAIPTSHYSLGSGSGLRGKGRSYSSPLPLSALDFIPVSSTDVFTPIPIVVRNYFGELLPRELQLDILTSLVSLHESEYIRAVKDGVWTASRASSTKNKWVGKDKGIRELVRLSRVSKSWQALVFDGQLWAKLHLRSFPKISSRFILRLTRMAGPFIRSFDTTGHTNMSCATLHEVTDNLCVELMRAGCLRFTQLTAVNFQGCSTLSTRSLHYLLIRSPSLQKVCLKGLDAATNTTCDVLAVYCLQLTSLDLSRCPNVDGGGIRTLALAAMARGERLSLKELRLSGLKHIGDEVMASLGKAAPDLEVLDLSYVRELHNSALDAFVCCEDEEEDFESISLTSREIGRDAGDLSKYRRRITRLRHLSVSSCILLTDIACSNLAHTMPRLEFLEMAGIGAELKDDGLVRLLKTTPHIRRLDLEDACDIGDTVLATLTPASAPGPGLTSTLETGHALECLILSYASNVTEDALLGLIRGCPRLVALEVDNTRISGAVLKEFVRLSLKRRSVNSRIVAIDCRGIGEAVVKDMTTITRPRKGWRSYEARKLGYLDSRDGEELKVGQDECDDQRVVLKSFYSWQMVDAVRAAREKRRKPSSRRQNNDSTGSASDSDDVFSTSGRARWWTPSGRRTSGNISPNVIDNHDRESCRIM